MPWNRMYRNRYEARTYLQNPPPFSVNPHCFIRKDHECGKVFGASKSCFIACPTDDDLEPTLELISEKLVKHQIEPIIAVKERAYGQDIFCTKICGKIIESRFCIVILDDTVHDGHKIPTPNVYYEYGLMTALRKHIIPLQKDGQGLAFNIQSYDTIKYSPRSLAGELEQAIRDAIQITEEIDQDGEHKGITDRTILRKLEVAGFEAKSHNWYLNSVIDDTQFIGFHCDAEEAYMLMAKIDSEDDISTSLEDLAVIKVRIEKKAADKQIEIQRVEAEYEEALRLTNDRLPRGLQVGYNLGESVKRLPHDKDILSRMRRIYVVFLVKPDLARSDFSSRIITVIGDSSRFVPVISEIDRLLIGTVSVDLVNVER